MQRHGRMKQNGDSTAACIQDIVRATNGAHVEDY
jgi:hypothetical protein